jgi:hypothetical protein
VLSGDSFISNVDNVFDARKVKIGDKVAGFTISELDVNAVDDNNYFAKVKFKGQVTVTGELLFEEPTDSSEGWGLLNYFIPDKSSINKIPVLNNSEERNGFTIIDNLSELENLRKKSMRFKAKIMIKDYELFESGKSQENRAKLIKIVEAVIIN